MAGRLSGHRVGTGPPKPQECSISHSRRQVRKKREVRVFRAEGECKSSQEFYFTRGLVLSSSPHWWALYFRTSAMYFVQASPLPGSTSVSNFCFLATIPVLSANLAPPLRLPTWLRNRTTKTVIRALSKCPGEDRDK